MILADRLKGIGDDASGIQLVGYVLLPVAGTTSTINVDLTNLQGGIDTQPRTDDVVYCFFSACSTDVGVPTLQYPTGYTALGYFYGNDTADSLLASSYKVMTATPDTSLSINGGTTDNRRAGHVIVAVFRGSSKTEFDTPMTTATGANSAAANPPPILPVTDGAVVICTATSAYTNGAYFMPSGFFDLELNSYQDDDQSSTAGLGLIYWSDGDGTIDSPAWDAVQRIAGWSSWASRCLVLKPE